MNGGEDNVMTDNIEKVEVLNIIFARHLRDQKVTGIVSIDLPKANRALVQPGCLS